MTMLTLHRIDDKSNTLDKEDIQNTTEDSTQHMQENCNVPSPNIEPVNSLDTKINSPNLHTQLNVQDKCPVQDESISTEKLDVKIDEAEWVPASSSISLTGQEIIQQSNFSPVAELKEKTEEKSEDEKWKVYKVERKVHKV